MELHRGIYSADPGIMAGVLFCLLCAVSPTSVLAAMANAVLESVLRVLASRMAVLSPNAPLLLLYAPTTSPGNHELFLTVLV